MKKLNYILILLVITAFFACKQEDILFTQDMANVGFYGETASMLEFDKSLNGKDELVVQILVTAVKNSPSCDVTFDVDNSWYQEINGAYYSIANGDTTQVNPAVEGVDFTIIGNKTVTVPDGYGYAPVTIAAIDNNYYDPLGNKSFRLKITGNSLGYDVSSESVMTVTIIDDDHPLGWFVGNYDLAATQSFNGDDQYPVLITTVEGEPDKVKIYGMCGPSYGPLPYTEDPFYIIGTVSQDFSTLTIKAGQKWEDWGYGFGPTIFKAWEDDNANGEEVDNLIGTINTDGGITITFNQASTFEITSGVYEGLGLQWIYNDDEATNSITSVWTKK